MAVPNLPPRERRFFIDSSAYLALLDRSDDHHAEASRLVLDLVTLGFRPFTTNVVVIEAHALIMSTLGIARGVEFLHSTESGGTTVVRVRAPDEHRAKEIIYRYQDKDFSFTDTISFAVMERLGIVYAFTYDRHFSQFGLAVL